MGQGVDLVELPDEVAAQLLEAEEVTPDLPPAYHHAVWALTPFVQFPHHVSPAKSWRRKYTGAVAFQCLVCVHVRLTATLQM